MSRTRTFLLALLCFLVGLTAPIMVPFALLCTRRTSNQLAWSWYGTPDLTATLIGTYEPQVQWVYDKFGWFAAGYLWFGLRNRAHGFDSLFAREAPGYWSGDTGVNGEFFWYKRQWLWFQFTFGWQVYTSYKFVSGYEYRPQLAIKTRRIRN